MKRELRWFRRFAEVPGVGYEGDLQLHARLPGRGATAEVNRLESFDGHPIVDLSWPGGASPASNAWTDASEGEASAKIRKRIIEVLELPGVIFDYHFAIQNAAEAFWKRRREEPEHLAFMEWLYWWDVRLVEAHPDSFYDPVQQRYLLVYAFDRLVYVYTREGFLHEALAAAERFARFLPERNPTLDELRERVARLREEHA